MLGAAILYVDQEARESSPDRGGSAMPTYILLSSLTAQAFRH
jgi:hypothetical protein